MKTIIAGGRNHHWSSSDREVLDRPLFQTEGFASQDEMDRWFSNIVNKGNESTLWIMKFTLKTPNK